MRVAQSREMEGLSNREGSGSSFAYVDQKWVSHLSLKLEERYGPDNEIIIYANSNYRNRWKSTEEELGDRDTG